MLALTTEEYILKAQKIFKDKFNYKNTIYRTKKVPLSIECRIHGIFKTLPNAHLESKYGKCPSCRNDVNFELFKQKTKELFEDRITFEKALYVNNRTNLTLTCNEHGDFISSPLSVLKSPHGCTVCAVKYKDRYKFKNIQEVLQELNKIHSSQYSYPSLSTVRRQDKIEVLCKIHGSFFPTLSSHLLGSGCGLCKQTENHNKRRRTLEEFIDLSNNVHNNTYTYEKAVYVNSITPLEITCPVHGSFMQRPDCHYNRKHGCPICRSTFRRSSKETELYDRILLHCPDTLHSYRPEWLEGKEIDIYIPSLQLGIEYNGYVFHHSSNNTGNLFLSTTFKSFDYHQSKYLKCLDNSVNLLHVFDFEDFDCKVNKIIAYIRNPSDFCITFKNNKRFSNNLEINGESFIEKISY